MKVSVSRSIHCAHQLNGLIHGHTYRVTVTHSGQVAAGFVIPVEELRQMMNSTLEMANHRQLEFVIGEPATAERLALWVKEQMRIPVQVRVDIGDEGWVETE